MKKTLNKKLALMLADLKKQRPYYCEVEYLESSGTQYIDTGIVYQNGYDIESYFTCNTSVASSKFLFGVYGTSLSRQCCFSTFRYWNTSSATANFYKGNQNQTVDNNSVNKVEVKNKTWYYNDTVNGDSWDFDASDNLTMYLFAGNTASGANYYFIGKVRSFKMWDAEHDIICDMIPVLDWEYTPCMYDKVTGQLFYNAGTGDFIAGREIHEVEYLEGDGEAYIDASYTPDDDAVVSFEGKVGYANGSSGRRFIFSDGNAYVTHYAEINATNYFGASGSYIPQELQADTLYDARVQINGGTDAQYWLNGEQATTSSYSSSTFGGLILFRLRGSYVGIGQRIGRNKIIVNNTLIRDYLPAIDENGVGFMFDRVTHTCFLNAGTGAFKYPAREIEYLQSGGSQYINTSIDLTTDDTLELNVDGSYVDLSSTFGQFFGVNGGAYFGVNTSNGFVVGSTTAVLTADTNRHTFKLESTIGNNKTNTLTIDGNAYTNTRNNATGTVYLYNLSQTSYGCKFKLYSSSIKKNGTLVRDFVPVYKSGTLGLFDKTNNVLYENIGSYSFTAGKIKEPEYE